MFFVHWYWHGALFAYGTVRKMLRWLDHVFGLRVNARFLFHPLYQERNVTGYLLGFIFRSLRLILGVLVGAVLCVCAVVVFVLWVGIPVYILVRVVQYII